MYKKSLLTIFVLVLVAQSILAEPEPDPDTDFDIDLGTEPKTTAKSDPEPEPEPETKPDLDGEITPELAGEGLIRVILRRQVREALETVESNFRRRELLTIRRAIRGIPDWIRRRLIVSYPEYFDSDIEVNIITVRRLIRDVTQGIDPLAASKLPSLQVSLAIAKAIQNLVNVAADPKVKGAPKVVNILNAVAGVIRAAAPNQKKATDMLAEIFVGIGDVVTAASKINDPPNVIYRGVEQGIGKIVNAAVGAGSPAATKVVSILNDTADIVDGAVSPKNVIEKISTIGKAVTDLIKSASQ